MKPKLLGFDWSQFYPQAAPVRRETFKAYLRRIEREGEAQYRAQYQAEFDSALAQFKANAKEAVQ